MRATAILEPRHCRGTNGRYRLQRGARGLKRTDTREVLEEKGAEVKIAVAFKVVPDDQDIQVASDGTLDFSKAKGTVSTYDLNALEAAAQLLGRNRGLPRWPP